MVPVRRTVEVEGLYITYPASLNPMFGVQGLGFRVWGAGFRVLCSGISQRIGPLVRTPFGKHPLSLSWWNPRGSKSINNAYTGP